MIHLGLIGHPLGHSLSPKIHGAALRACSLEGDYSLFPISPEDKHGLGELLSKVRSGQLTGLNVTIPHKQHVIEFMDELTSTAKSIGAVNTIYMREDRLVGDNTDAVGFLKDLNYFLNNQKPAIDNRKSALVLGAGGSARAVVHALANDGWNVTLYARRIEQAQELAAALNARPMLIVNELSKIELSNVSLIVNTTPVGMTPNIDRSPWPDRLAFPKAAIYDLVYNPRQTKLMKDACAQGLNATTGLGMLVEQAALAFELWTGCNPPREALFAAVNG